MSKITLSSISRSKRKLNILAVACLCVFIGLNAGCVGQNTTEQITIHGSALFNGAPDTVARMLIIYPDHVDTMAPDTAGNFTVTINTDTAQKIKFTRNGNEILSYLPPFSDSKIYTSYIGVPVVPQ